MNYTFTGKNIVVSEALKDKSQEKIGRLSRLFTENTEIFVTFSVVKHDNTIEVTIPLHRRMLRAEVTSVDMYSAIDEAVEILEKQMVKYKSRIRDKSRKDSSYKEEATMNLSQLDDFADDTEEIRIEKTKRFAVKPMDAEEAVMEMEMLGHTFFVFRDSKSDDINVVYKRKNGSYGLIDPSECVDED